MLSLPLEPSAACVLAAALAAAGFAWWRLRASTGRPYSYPGDAVPPESRLRGQMRFRKGGYLRVEPGWRPVVEAQPSGVSLPRQVAGQQVWTFDASQQEPAFDFNADENPNAGDKIYRRALLQQWTGQRPEDSKKPGTALEAVRKGFQFYQMLQCEDGHWGGDYGGPHFLIAGLVIAAYIMGCLEEVFPAPHRRALEVYLRNHQQEDGGWGSHLESPSNMLGSTFNYVALRLLGVSKDDAACVQGRAFMEKHGGALYAPLWPKFWLAVLGVYDWQGITPVPPELWLLPHWFPLHPGRFWCHIRMIYVPMCFLYAKRFSYDAAADPVTMSLRSELYPGREYSKIDWCNHRYSIADCDNFSPVHWIMRLAQGLFQAYENLGAWPWLRERSLRFVEEYMHAEDVETNYLTIAPISKAFHMVCTWIIAGGELDKQRANRSEEIRRHISRVPAYLWVAEDGMKVQGYNGSQAWDTAFAIQGLKEAGLAEEFPAMCAKAAGWFAREQVRALPQGDWRHWRQPIRGGWGFSTAEQAWPVSDTTGEAFKAVLALRPLASCSGVLSTLMPDQHYFDSVDFLLSYQNADGGWATYENCRGWKWYELLNPVESFGDIMIDYSYVECSSSSMGALADFAKQFPGHRSKEIQQAIRRGVGFIKAMQRDDGSWYGCWGSCFVYGCWFGVEGLIVGGEAPSCAAVRRCVAFLLSKQNSDGGWGEDFASCFNRSYESNSKLPGCDSGSSVIQTAWALLAIMAADCKEDAGAVRRGIEFLMKRQEPSGDFPQENIVGVFNRSIGITYTAFRNVFPLWALGRFATSYGPCHVE